MKREIGNVDAIEVEAASAAYVENFALKVFQSADNEDRKGVATRFVECEAIIFDFR
jgi:vacuolar protein sorting-associated protein VTA1